MKNNIKYILSLGLMITLTWGDLSEALGQSVTYFFFAPTDSMRANFGAANIKGYTKNSGEDRYTVLPGYRYVVVDDSNLPTFRSVAPANLVSTYDSLNKDTELKKKIDKILQISGVVDVSVLLVDDRTGLAQRDRWVGTKQDRKDNRWFVWPAARNWKNDSDSRYTGQVYLGERAVLIDTGRAGGFRNWEGTIIHEFSHTQFLRDPEYGSNKWGHGGVAVSYGGDAGHWFIEIMADEQMALNEGLASFWGLAHNPAAAQRIISFLNDKKERFFLGSRSFLSGTKAMWDAPHHVVYSGPVSNMPSHIRLNTSITANEGNYELREYKWLDVPGKYIMHNEQMSQSFFYLYYEYAFAEKERAYNRIFQAAQAMARPNVHNRYPGFAANHLAASMEYYAGSSLGEKDAANHTLVSSMFPYALLDLLTHFGMDEEDMKRYFRVNQAGGKLPLAYDAYWDRRDEVRQVACKFLGGNNCQGGDDDIDIRKAVEAVRDYFKAPATILKQSGQQSE